MSYDPYAIIYTEKEMKPKHIRVFEFIVDYVARNGTMRGAFRDAARVFYPDKPLTTGIKRAWDLFTYALKRRHFGTSISEFPENSSEQDGIEDRVEYNMEHYISNHSGPVKDTSKFVKDSKANRRLFEMKKLAYAILQDLVKPKTALASYVEETFKDPRLVIEVGKLDENIWYNGKSYVKIDKKAAALLYLVVFKIYTRHYGVGNRPEKLIKRFFEVTGYAPRDLGEHIKAYITIFYDWLLFL